MIRLLPDSLVGRTLLFSSGLILFLIMGSAVLLQDERHEQFRELNRSQVLDKVVTLTRILQTAPISEQSRIIQQAKKDHFQISLDHEPSIFKPARHPLARILQRRLHHKLTQLPPHAIRVSIQLEDHRYDNEHNDDDHDDDYARRSKHKFEAIRFSIQLDNNNWLNIEEHQKEGTPPWAKQTLFFLITLLITLGLAAFIMARQFAKPMKALADAADRFGLGQETDEIAPQGPKEVRQTILAFNQMRERLDKHLEDRRLMLSAISHDLRTPITTLRLRAEYIEDDEMRLKTLATLEEMEGIISASLQFSRDEAADESSRAIDIASLLQSLADDHADLGGETHYQGNDSVIFNGRPIALKRALNNLIENALKYGSKANITLLDEKQRILIKIQDHGPGIPEDKLEQVFTPFYRLEDSRNRETGGTGLGLAVARIIVHAHGGELTLRNQAEGGLSAELSLPRL